MKIIRLSEVKPIIDQIYGTDINIHSPYAFVAIVPSNSVNPYSFVKSQLEIGIKAELQISGRFKVTGDEEISTLEFLDEINKMTPSLKWYSYSNDPAGFLQKTRVPHPTKKLFRP